MYMTGRNPFGVFNLGTPRTGMHLRYQARERRYNLRGMWAIQMVSGAIQDAKKSVGRKLSKKTKQSSKPEKEKLGGKLAVGGSPLSVILPLGRIKSLDKGIKSAVKSAKLNFNIYKDQGFVSGMASAYKQAGMTMALAVVSGPFMRSLLGMFLSENSLGAMYQLLSAPTSEQRKEMLKLPLREKKLE